MTITRITSSPISTVNLPSSGKAEVTAPTPADTETATVRM